MAEASMSRVLASSFLRSLSSFGRASCEPASTSYSARSACSAGATRNVYRGSRSAALAHRAFKQHGTGVLRTRRAEPRVRGQHLLVRAGSGGGSYFGNGLDSPVHIQDPVDADPSITAASGLEAEGRRPDLLLGFGEDQMAYQCPPLGGPTATTVAVAARYQPRFLWWVQTPDEEVRLLNQGLNAVLVAALGASALTKVFTVDQDLWRGWTLFEILWRVPIDNWAAYQSLLDSNPVLAKMFISGFVYAMGDWSAQTCEGRPLLEFDRMRMLRSGLVGLCFHGSLSHYYYHFCEWLFPFQDWWVVPVKVAFDQTIWSACWNSLYFTLLGMLRMESPVTIWKELRETFWPLLTAGWKLWPFAHIITYGVVPVEHRLLWVDMVELVWVTILSMYANEKQEERNAVLGPAPLAAAAPAEVLHEIADGGCKVEEGVRPSEYEQ